MYHHEYPRYIPSPAFSAVSSGVSTPGMTPPIPQPGYMFEHFMSHPPSWVPQPRSSQEAILPQLMSLQHQTNQLISSLQTNGMTPIYYPTSYNLGMRNAHGPSPAPAPACASGSEAIHIARSILEASPLINEQVIAKAVVAVANALVMKNSSEGYIHDLGGPKILIPEAVRSQTPAWLSAVAESTTDIQSTPVFGSLEDPVSE